MSDFKSNGFIEAKQVYGAPVNVYIACLFYLGKTENKYWCGRQAALTSLVLALVLQSDTKPRYLIRTLLALSSTIGLIPDGPDLMELDSSPGSIIEYD